MQGRHCEADKDIVIIDKVSCITVKVSKRERVKTYNLLISYKVSIISKQSLLNLILRIKCKSFLNIWTILAGWICSLRPINVTHSLFIFVEESHCNPDWSEIRIRRNIFKVNDIHMFAEKSFLKFTLSDSAFNNL